MLRRRVKYDETEMRIDFLINFIVQSLTTLCHSIAMAVEMKTTFYENENEKQKQITEKKRRKTKTKAMCARNKCYHVRRTK